MPTGLTPADGPDENLRRVTMYLRHDLEDGTEGGDCLTPGCGAWVRRDNFENHKDNHTLEEEDREWGHAAEEARRADNDEMYERLMGEPTPADPALREALSALIHTCDGGVAQVS